MRRKITLLLLMLGVLSAPLTFYAVGSRLSAGAIVAGAFILGYAYLLFVKDYSDVLWGIRFEGQTQSVVRQGAGALGLMFGGYCSCFTALRVVFLFFDGDAVRGMLIILLFALSTSAGAFFGRLTVMKGFSEKRVDEALSAHPLFIEISEKISLAACFIVSREWIALYDEYYCFAVYLYKEHKLCEVLTAEQFGILCGYFARKNEKEFCCKNEIKMICARPGHGDAPATEWEPIPSECCVFTRRSM